MTLTVYKKIHYTIKKKQTLTSMYLSKLREAQECNFCCSFSYLIISLFSEKSHATINFATSLQYRNLI